MSYQQDRGWSDSYVSELQRIIGPHLLAPSTLEQDRKEAADLVVLRGRDVTIACRIRRPGYAVRYPLEFTIRSRRDSGAVTEFEKIIDGWGDWFFYGHATERFPTIQPWWLIDLSSFRSHLIRNKSMRRVRHGERQNGDGTYFHWFRIDSFPALPQLLIAQSNVEAAASPRGELTATDISW